MMDGRLFIDGHDAFKQWGVYVVFGGWNEAIAYPPLKTPESNDWQETDGTEADLSNPQLDTKEVSIRFAFCGLYSSFVSFVEMLADGAYHEFDAVSIRRKFTLRMTQVPNLDMVQSLGSLTIKFSNDFPMQQYEYVSPQSCMQPKEDYMLDGIPFTAYGCRILQGTIADVLKPPAVKPNLLRNITNQPGAIYDSYRVTFKTKDVKLNCLMRAESLDELWRNYDALLFDLIRPDERFLEVAELQQAFPCYYKSSSVNELYPEGKIWLSFTITLTFTYDLRIITDPLLATEDGLLLILEDADENDFITLKPQLLWQ